MYAVRNIRLCTKDCLCLFVCPSGATDTENGQIDKDRCIRGCRLCVDSCPSHAIYLLPEEYPLQQEKSEEVKTCLGILSKSKAEFAIQAESLIEKSEDGRSGELLQAMAASSWIMAEDLMREAGFMLPGSREALDLLESLAASETGDDFPHETVKSLIRRLSKPDHRV